MPRFFRHLARSLRSVLTALLVVASAGAPSSGASIKSNSRTAVQSSPEATHLEPGVTIERKMGGTETHRFTLSLDTGQYAHLFIDQRGVDVAVTVTMPDGKVAAKVDRPNTSRGRDDVSIIATASGMYWVELHRWDARAPTGGYHIRLIEVRAATPRDESRIAAEKAVTEGEVLRARRTAESLAQSVELLNQSLALWKALDEPYEQAVTLYGLCLVHRLRGDYEPAVRTCDGSYELMRATGDEFGAARALTGRGWSYTYVSELDRALADFAASSEIRRRAGDVTDVPFNLYGIGYVHMLRKDYDAALDYLQQSISLLEKLGDPRGRTLRFAAIGETHRRRKSYAEAERYFTDTLNLLKTEQNLRLEADTLTNLGWTLLAENKTAEAAERFSRALPMRRDAGDRTGVALTLLGLAHAARESGNLDASRAHIEEAIQIIEALRTGIADQSLRLSFFASAQDFYEFYTDLLMAMHRRNPQGGFAVRALEASERARARALLDQTRAARIELRSDLPADLRGREQAARARLAEALKYQQQLLSDRYTQKQAEAAANLVYETSSQLAAVETEARRAGARAPLLQPRTLSATQIQSELDEDSLLLQFALGKRRSHLWAVTRTQLTVYELPPRDELDSLALRWRELLTERNRSIAGESPNARRARIARSDEQAQEVAAHLSRSLLAPLANRLSARRLIIVAPGVLQLIPFASLPAPITTKPLASNKSIAEYIAQPRAAAQLIGEHEVVILPSISTIAALRSNAANRTAPTKVIAIYADPVLSASDERLAGDNKREVKISLNASRSNINQEIGKLPRLSRTSWEADQILALAPVEASLVRTDFAANRAAAMGPELGQFRIVHFATHALVDDQRPEHSGIALSQFDASGRAQNGLMGLQDIYGLRLSAELVFLSACQTASGRDYQGEGIVGIARAFIYAGAPRVIGSLWTVDDKVTAELSVRFYRKLFKEKMRPAAALRAAQLELKRDDRWQLPYFWAGFTLQGEWK